MQPGTRRFKQLVGTRLMSSQPGGFAFSSKTDNSIGAGAERKRSFRSSSASVISGFKSSARSLSRGITNQSVDRSSHSMKRKRSASTGHLSSFAKEVEGDTSLLLKTKDAGLTSWSVQSVCLEFPRRFFTRFAPKILEATNQNAMGSVSFYDTLTGERLSDISEGNHRRSLELTLEDSIANLYTHDPLADSQSAIEKSRIIRFLNMAATC